MSLEELLALPVSVNAVTAARALGIGRSKAFELLASGDFPCRCIKVGRSYKVPRSALFEVLGVDPGAAVAQADVA